MSDTQKLSPGLDDLIVTIKGEFLSLTNDITDNVKLLRRLNEEKIDIEQRIIDVSGNIEFLKERKSVLEHTIKESEDAYNKIIMSTQLLADTISSKLN